MTLRVHLNRCASDEIEETVYTKKYPTKTSTPRMAAIRGNGGEKQREQLDNVAVFGLLHDTLSGRGRSFIF